MDDHTESRALLLGYLARYQEESLVEFVVEEFADGSELTGTFAPRFDIIFLDVEMTNLDGFATARIIREIDPAVIIIFVTNMAQFAVKGYEVDALSYLLKPVPYFAFAQELKRCTERLARSHDESILLSIGGELVRVMLPDVVYVESVKHRLIIHTSTRPLSLVGTLREMSEQLEPRGFFRCNSYLLVNLSHVTGLSGSDVKLVGDIELPVSRARRKPFIEALTAYFGGRVS